MILKKIIFFIFITFIFSCEIYNYDPFLCVDEPKPSYGMPNQTIKETYKEFRTIKYIYNCYQGQYIEVTWYKYKNNCWLKDNDLIRNTCLE